MMGGFIARVFKYSGWRNLRQALLMPRGPRGFTVIEVLVVLAVTGGLFIGAALLIAGRQQQTEFNQAIRQVQSQIQQIINNVQTGHYPSTNSFQCTATASGPSFTAGTGTQQGANSGCIFLGEAMQFKVAGTRPEQFSVFSLAGLQKSGANEVTSLAQAMPKAIPGITTSQELQGGLSTVDMWYVSGGVKRSIGVVAFVNSLAQFSGGSIVSGTQQVNVVPVDDNQANSALDKTNEQAASAIDASLATSPVNPASGVFLCFESGGTRQSGLITIGTNARQLSVTLDIKSNTDCS